MSFSARLTIVSILQVKQGNKMAWFRVDFNDVFFNGLSTLEIGCVVKYKCLCQQLNVDKLNANQLKTNFYWKERQFLIKHFALEVETQKKVETKSEQTENNPETKSEQSEDKVRHFLPSKNNDLASVYNNNIYNIPDQNRKEIPSNEGTKKPPKKIKTLVADDWQPDDKTREKLQSMGLDVAKTVEKFINSCHAKGLKYIDFNRAILSWNWSNDVSVKANNNNNDNDFYEWLERTE